MKKFTDVFVWITAKVISRTNRELKVLVIDRNMRERAATLPLNYVTGEQPHATQPEYRELRVPARWAHQAKLDASTADPATTHLTTEDYSALELRVAALQASGQALPGFNLPQPLAPTGRYSGPRFGPTTRELLRVPSNSPDEVAKQHAILTNHLRHKPPK